MKKVTLLIAGSKINEALSTLRKEGVLHVKHIKLPASPDIDQLNREVNIYKKAFQKLGEYKASQSEHAGDAERLAIADKILELDDRKRELQQKAKDIHDKIARQEIWGNFSVTDIRMLEKNGVYIKLYTCRKKDLKKIPENSLAEVIKLHKGKAYIALITRNINETLPLNSAEVPDISLRELNEELKENKLEINLVEKEIHEFARFRDILQAESIKAQKRLEFHKVRSGMGAEEGFSYLQGYCPVTRLASLTRVSDANSWGMLAEDVTEDEDPPVLLKNSLLGRIIKPVFEFMGTVPGYREYDISEIFLLFFSIFFAMIIGDAGYGILFLAATYFAGKKLSKVPKEIFLLFYVLSISTIVWGALSGTWFGIEKLARLPLFNLVVVEKVNSYIASNQTNIIELCFVIGLVHLIIAHSIVGLRLINSVRFLGQLGWILILCGFYFFAGYFVLSKQLNKAAIWLVLTGALLVILFSGFSKKSIFKSIAAGLGNLQIGFISSFSDIISYIRLFAVGYASVTLASSFNEMALNIGMGSILRSFMFAFILLVGHSLNIILGIMGVIVHGIRLNMLEFSGHLGMQWSGSQYRPFK